jgi:hypothetical protein
MTSLQLKILASEPKQTLTTIGETSSKSSKRSRLIQMRHHYKVSTKWLKSQNEHIVSSILYKRTELLKESRLFKKARSSHQSKNYKSSLRILKMKL